MDSDLNAVIFVHTSVRFQHHQGCEHWKEQSAA
jgi:hypothetical protein